VLDYGSNNNFPCNCQVWVDVVNGGSPCIGEASIKKLIPAKLSLALQRQMEAGMNFGEDVRVRRVVAH